MPHKRWRQLTCPNTPSCHFQHHHLTHLQYIPHTRAWCPAARNTTHPPSPAGSVVTVGWCPGVGIATPVIRTMTGAWAGSAAGSRVCSTPGPVVRLARHSLYSRRAVVSSHRTFAVWGGRQCKDPKRDVSSPTAHQGSNAHAAKKNTSNGGRGQEQHQPGGPEMERSLPRHRSASKHPKDTGQRVSFFAKLKHATATRHPASNDDSSAHREKTGAACGAVPAVWRWRGLAPGLRMPAGT